MRRPVFAIAMTISACAAPSHYERLSAQTRVELITRYARGESVAEIADDLRISNYNEARQMVHDAIIALERRYYRGE